VSQGSEPLIKQILMIPQMKVWKKFICEIIAVCLNLRFRTADYADSDAFADESLKGHLQNH